MSVDRSSQRPGGPMGRGPMGGGAWGAVGRPTEKAKNFKGTVRRFSGYFMPQKYRLIAVVIAAIISTTFTIVGPKILGLATTRLFQNLEDAIKATFERQAILAALPKAAAAKHIPLSVLQSSVKLPSVPGVDLAYIGTVL